MQGTGEVGFFLGTFSGEGVSGTEVQVNVTGRSIQFKMYFNNSSTYIDCCTDVSGNNNPWKMYVLCKPLN